MFKHIKKPSIYLVLALTLFFISAFYGWLMRLNAFIDLPFLNYTRVLQSHSHVTFLGWGFIAITALFNYRFLPKGIAFSTKYNLLFGLQIGITALMLVSFPLQGYKLFSIALLSSFALLSYLYFYFFYKDYQLNKALPLVHSFLKASVFYYLLAMGAIWALGFVMAKFGKGEIYSNTIYFYLHFLYNGFFIFGLLALLFDYLNQIKVSYSATDGRKFFVFMNMACIPAYLLSLVKIESLYILLIGGLAAVLQIIAWVYFYRIAKHIKPYMKGVKGYLFQIFYAAFLIKTILQLGSVLPFVREQLPSLKSYFIIGYIHLVTLGIISTLLLFFLLVHRFVLASEPVHKLGFLLFVVGFLGTEICLFGQGFSVQVLGQTIPYYEYLLAGFSTVLVLGVLSVWSNSISLCVKPKKVILNDFQNDFYTIKQSQ